MSVHAEALSVSFKAVRRTLLAYLRRKVGDASVAEDLLQDVFLKAIAAGRDKALPGNLTGWLYAIARNAVADHYRAKRPSEPLPEDLPAADPDEDRMHQQLATCLRPFTEAFPPIYRDTLIATDFEGRTMRSLAAASGLSVSAIKSRASRARAMLKDKVLACCHVELSGSGLVTDYRRREKDCCDGPGGCG